ncbi:MAG: ABC transporter permease [Bacteroidales bacterium]|nr:ABC transporter permease [Bacteroidales bacterium]MDD2425278.1 ABC transporter permease [Bacteroidales bacterium]MDD3989247.1 ABC transporter permease [Bacteroidales bacterium]
MKYGFFKENISLVFTLLSAVILLFLIAPLAGLFLSLKAPALFETIKDPAVSESIFITLLISSLFTLAAAIFALPLAYLLARKRFPGKGFVEGLIDIPVVIPHSAAGIAILGFISRDSVLGSIAAGAGLNLVGSPFAIGLAMAFVSIPFLINSARDGFAAVPLRLEQAARTLGASGLRVFTSISLPLAKRSVVSGLVLMFARGMSEFGAVVIVAYHPMTTPVMIFDRFNSYGIDYARPVAAIFIAVTLIIFFLLRVYQKR